MLLGGGLRSPSAFLVMYCFSYHLYAAEGIKDIYMRSNLFIIRVVFSAVEPYRTVTEQKVRTILGIRFSFVTFKSNFSYLYMMRILMSIHMTRIFMYLHMTRIFMYLHIILV